MKVELPEILMIAAMMVEARPVMVMQPAMQPAIAQAAATEMQLLPPAASASKNLPIVMRQSLLKMLTTMEATMAIAAEKAIVLELVETR